MKYNKRIWGISFIFICIFFLTACSQTPHIDKEEEEKTFSEGVNTVCEITGYTDLTKAFPEYFLQKGDKVAVISPSALPSKAQVDATIEGLKKWGYEPVEGRYVCDRERNLENCIEDLTWALTEQEIKAVFCVRGGYGASEVMDSLAKDLVLQSNKPIIGYSDITIYHAAWNTVGLPSIHSSMSATFTGLPENCLEAEELTLQGKVPSYRCDADPLCKTGSAEGILIGGNLSTFAATLGTEYDITRTGQPYILFLEDVNEDMAHIHRLLTILKHQGVFERAAGILFGEWTDVPEVCADYNGEGRGGTFASIADMISREILTDVAIPVAFGFPAGHGDFNYPLIMGVSVKLDVNEDEYTLEWTDPALMPRFYQFDRIHCRQAGL